jgi:hypothetical protein
MSWGEVILLAFVAIPLGPIVFVLWRTGRECDRRAAESMRQLLDHQRRVSDGRSANNHAGNMEEWN